MNRQKYNLEILDSLKSYFEANPDIRFFQGLWNTGIIETTQGKIQIIKDKFSEESEETFFNLNLK